MAPGHLPSAVERTALVLTFGALLLAGASSAPAQQAAPPPTTSAVDGGIGWKDDTIAC